MNGVRGEVSISIEGEPHRLCLTLGALADIETAFGCKSLAELQARMRALSASELMLVLGALLKGGCGTDAAMPTAMHVNAADAARAVAEAFHAALG